MLLLLFGARVGSRKCGAGLDDDAGSRRFRRRSVRGAHRHRNAQFAMGLALVHAARGRDVRVVAANGHANMAVCPDKVVRRAMQTPGDNEGGQRLAIIADGFQEP